jgi:hypothetical protein
LGSSNPIANKENYFLKKYVPVDFRKERRSYTEMSWDLGKGK